MNLRPHALGLALAVGLSGCLFGDETDAPSGPCPEGRSCDSSQPPGTVHPKRADGSVGVSAEEAWPDRAAEPDPLSAQELAEACAVLAACVPVDPKEGNVEGARKILMSLCAQPPLGEPMSTPPGSYFWEERAVPTSSPGKNERWTFEARAVIAAGGDCDKALAVGTERAPQINCEEAGCWWSSPDKPIPVVTCKGDVATLVTDGLTVERDCTRSLGRCDEASPTGCSDRAPVACEHPAKDRCDGDVRVGCDGTGKVSFHDCARIPGGTCGEIDADGHLGCVAPDAGECTAGGASCEGDALGVCVFGAKVTVDCKALGLGACVSGLCPAP